MKSAFSVFLLFTLLVVSSEAGIYKIQNNQLYIDNVAQPQLFGAEVQYFRLRGGYAPNVPRAEVIKLWEAALDRLVEAHMNAISFYIPWDFHEYAEGKFDFDGTVDDDGDGNPDYPSRDVKTFFKMIEARGIKHIMVRPGPYINAEWGFLGFGAIPLWFHEKYPESHMKNSLGQSTKLYDYHNEDLIRHTELWFKKVLAEVLKDKIGPGKPISFLQLDNETNFMWQSLYNHDYSAGTIRRYQDFLITKYQTLFALNESHQRHWESFAQVQAPVSARSNYREDQDWYIFADQSVAVYLQKVRKVWESLGVREPQVLFTLADSYNATQNGLLPNYILHNQPGLTGLLTVNLYPKTYDTADHPLLNLPFKTDHDVKAAESASALYFGNSEQWAMGPEIQAGWWRGIPVTSEARQQTYLSVLGHGMKALFVYYFNEGDNWQTDWARKQITPIYNQLHETASFRDVADANLPDHFWQMLQNQVDRQLLAGFDVRFIMREDTKSAEKLYFDAPLSYGVVASEHFFKLKELGEKLIAPHAEWLGQAVELTDPVCLLKDQEQNIPSYLAAIDSVEMNSTWESGLVGYLMQGGINPRILHWGISTEKELEACSLIIRQDSGETSLIMATTLEKLIRTGHHVLNFLDDSLSVKMGIKAKSSPANAGGYLSDVNVNGKNIAARSAPLFHYSDLDKESCHSLLIHAGENAGFQCQMGEGTFTQIGVLFYDVYNSNEYGRISDLETRASILDNILKTAKVSARIEFLFPDHDAAIGKIVAFARKVKSQDPLWITVKSAMAQTTSQRLLVKNLEKTRLYSVQNLLTSEVRLLKGQEIGDTGFSVQLPAFGSTVYWLQ